MLSNVPPFRQRRNLAEEFRITQRFSQVEGPDSARLHYVLGTEVDNDMLESVLCACNHWAAEKFKKRVFSSNM